MGEQYPVGTKVGPRHAMRRRDRRAQLKRERRGPIVRSRDIWRNRKTLWLLVKRDLKVRYAGSTLGYVWTFLEPLMMSGVYWFVFTQIFQRSVGQDPYIIFLLTGLLPWMWFNGSVNAGMKALISQAKLVRATGIPREIWVLRAILSKGIEFTFSLPVLAVFLFFYPTPINVNLWLFPVAIVLQFVLLVGIGFVLAPLMVLLKDVEPLVGPILRLGFYATPIIYGIHDITNRGWPEWYANIFFVNPMAGITSAYRSGFFVAEQSWLAIGIAAVIAFFTLVVGWWLFARLEKTTLKEI